MDYGSIWNGNKVHAKWLAVLFAIFGGIAAFGIGCLTQANSISTALKQNFGVDERMAGVVVAILTAIVIIGGVKSITKVTERLIPFMAAFYVLGCLWVIFMNRSVLGQSIALIFKSAFSFQAGAGGVFGFTVAKALRYGCARGLFSNESGMGSAPIVAASAKTRNPVRQSLVSMTGTFWDTVVICALTGITLVSSAVAHPEFLEAGINTDTTVLTFQAFALIPTVGKPIIAISLALFAYSTILGWSYYGERCAEYLLGSKVIKYYKIMFVILSFVGCIVKLATVWNIADILNGLMIIPNVIGVFLLSGVLIADLKKYANNIDEVDTTPIPVVDKD